MNNDVTGRVNSALEGRYRTERELGAGGMATVYLAHDLKHDRVDRYMWSALASFDASSFQVEDGERLFELEDLRTDTQRPIWDVVPDGRFRFMRQVGIQGGVAPILAQNWVQESTGMSIR